MLKEEFESISQMMSISFRKTTSMIDHPGEKGTSRENALIKYLRPHIPDKYEMSEGIIVDSQDHQSKQVDVIIHDKNTTPFLQDTSLSKIIPIECVYSVIEVKSLLTKDTLEQSIKNIQSVRSLYKNTICGDPSPTLGFVFAYDSDSSLETIYGNYLLLTEEVPYDQRITCICILNKGLILPVNKHHLSTISLFTGEDTIFAMHQNSGNALLLFYLLLFQALSSAVMFPPNMMAYANSTGDLDTNIYIPKDYVPEIATVPFLDKMISIAEINEMQKNGERILSGELQEEDFLECIFNMYIPMIMKAHGSLDQAIGQGELNYFGHIIHYDELISMYMLYHKEIPTAAEIEVLNRFRGKYYEIYDQHRDEMRKNFQKNHK